MLMTLAVLLTTLSPLLGVVLLLEAAAWRQRRRDTAVARQIALIGQSRAPFPLVFSICCTASAPSGIGAPVMIFAHWPRATRFDGA